MTFLLDTDTVSYLIRGEDQPRMRLGEADEAFVAISSLTAAEIEFGLRRRSLSLVTRDAVVQFLDAVKVYQFDLAAAKAAGQVRADLHKLGRPSGRLDELIAGHAISLGAVLVTNNTRHFEQIPEIKLDNWMA